MKSVRLVPLFSALMLSGSVSVAATDFSPEDIENNWGQVIYCKDYLYKNRDRREGSSNLDVHPYTQDIKQCNAANSFFEYFTLATFSREVAQDIINMAHTKAPYIYTSNTKRALQRCRDLCGEWAALDKLNN